MNSDKLLYDVRYSQVYGHLNVCASCLDLVDGTTTSPLTPKVKHVPINRLVMSELYDDLYEK
jgi:hypothetical protein